MCAARCKRSLIATPAPFRGMGCIAIEVDFVIFAKLSRSAKALYKFMAASSGSEISDRVSPLAPFGSGPKASSNSLSLGSIILRRIGVSG